MSRTFEVKMEAEITIGFSDPDKAEEYFVNGEWSECFWDVLHNGMAERKGQISMKCDKRPLKL